MPTDHGWRKNRVQRSIVSDRFASSDCETGLSQETVGAWGEVDRTYISQVERKQRNVTVSVLARIAKALGTTPDRLLIPPPIMSAKPVRKHR
jgi:transcriptional regulator with XRE-family HTH domain